MTLQIVLRHDFLGGDTREVFSISPRELEAGVDIASLFRDEERALLSPLTARYVDDETVEIAWRGDSRRYSVREGGDFSTGWLTLHRKTVKIEGEEYDNDHEVMASVQLLPRASA